MITKEQCELILREINKLENVYFRAIAGSFERVTFILASDLEKTLEKCTTSPEEARCLLKDLQGLNERMSRLEAWRDAQIRKW